AMHAAGLAQDQALELLNERHRLASVGIKRARARVAVGDAASSTLDDASVEAARIEHEIEDAKHARAAQTRALTALLGARDAQRPLAGELDEAFDLPALEELLRDLEGLPVMREAEAAVALASARARVASAARLPLLRLDAGWRERTDGRNSVDLALGFTIPWSGSSAARSRAAELEAAAQRARSIQTGRELALAVADAHDTAVLALHRLEIHDEVLLPAAERQRIRAIARVRAGDAAPAFATAAEETLLAARLERLMVWADLAAAWADLGALLIRSP
ncbi:MAG: TolC family protein, partial [Planctomycetota bacterium]|nr:TolC family protein [Planctomycetota bacterium]